jgi:hypothetical protein
MLKLSDPNQGVLLLCREVHRSITVAEAGEHAGAIWRLLWRERGKSDAKDCREW